MIWALGAISATIYWVAYCWQDPYFPQYFFKVTATILMAVAATFGGWPILIIIAFWLCAIGDYFIANEGKRSVLYGMGSFAVVNVLFIAQILIGHELHLNAQTFMFAAVFTAIAITTEIWLVPYAGDLKTPMRGFVFIIWAAICCAGLTEDMFLIAGALFYCGTVIVTGIEFFRLSTQKQLFYSALTTWPLYFGSLVFYSLGFGAVV